MSTVQIDGPWTTLREILALAGILDSFPCWGSQNHTLSRVNKGTGGVLRIKATQYHVIAQDPSVEDSQGGK